MSYNKLLNGHQHSLVEFPAKPTSVLVSMIHIIPLDVQFNLKALDNQISALKVFTITVFELIQATRTLRDVLQQAQARYRTNMVYDGSGTTSHAARGLTIGVVKSCMDPQLSLGKI